VVHIKMQKIRILSLDDFKSNIEELSAGHKEETLLFRGQTEDRPLIPSILRGKRGMYPHAPGCNPSLMVNWQAYVERMIKTLGADIGQQHTDAVMQHYGYRSFFVDVTSDPTIALWFALHRFESKKTACYVDDDLKSAVFQVSRFVWSGKGFVYVIALPKHQSVRFVNLVKVMPLTATRIHRQKAGALYYHNIKPIDEFIIAKFEVNDANWFKESFVNITTSELFPLPKFDLFYRHLCTIPYFVSPERDMNNIKIGHPLLGEFPIYADSPKQLVKEFLPLTRLIDQAHPALKWDLATQVKEFEGQRLKIAGASRLTLEKLLIDKISESTTRCTQLYESFPTQNFIIEFELGASLIGLSETALGNLVRGIWVTIGKQTIRIIELVDDFKKISLSHECVYSKKDLKLVSKSCDCSNHQEDLKIVLEIGRGLFDGTLVLKQADVGYMNLEPRDY
jgi:hypothetical protein